jgi:hypothetical protein
MKKAHRQTKVHRCRKAFVVRELARDIPSASMSNMPAAPFVDISVPNAVSMVR